MIVNKGKIVDASIVETRRQHNTHKENKDIKDGAIPDGWVKKPGKLRQKDTDARWTKKNDESFFGYKNHVKIDKKKKFIDHYAVTDAATHDSIGGVDLLEERDRGQTLHADSEYAGAPFKSEVDKVGMVARIHEKGTRGHPLKAAQKARNKVKSKIRARIEHVFGDITQRRKDMLIRSVGYIRACARIGLMNLTYNVCRFRYYRYPARVSCANSEG